MGWCVMLRGNLSNEVRPRVLLVFEGALGFLSDKRVKEFNRCCSEGMWGEGWGLWELNDLMMRKIWDVVQRQMIQVEVATLFIPEDFCDVAATGLQETLDDHGLPVSRVFAMEAPRLAREIMFMPDLACVYDANPETAACYGTKGRLLRNVHDFCRF